jgi:cell volume regulation protein A
MIKAATRGITPYIVFAGLAGLLWLAGANVSVISEQVHHAFDEGSVHAFLILLAFLAIGKFSEYISRAVPLESFVLAIGLGIAGSQLLEPYTGSSVALTVVVNAAVAIILLQGGLEVKLENFKKLFWVIMMLSIPGLFIAAVMLSFASLFIASALGVAMLPTVALLLGAILVSTDPAALVALFKKLKLMDKTAGVAVIAESAGTDVTGTLLTIKMLSIVTAFGAAASFDVWGDGYATILTVDSFKHIGWEMFAGTLVGISGYYGLLALERYLGGQSDSHGVDPIGVKLIGLITFGLAYVLHGSGYLAVFVMGLLFTATGHHMKKAEHGVNDYIDALLKPAVFISLGAIVDVNLLLQYAPVGIAIGLAFMFLVRPAQVFACLSPFVWWSTYRRKQAALRGEEVDPISDVSIKDVTFMASVRETGAIPAALLVTVMTKGIEGAPMLVAIGLIVILMTLFIGPSYKPALARKLGLVN